MKTYLAVRKFGLLLAQAEKVYEKDWGKSQWTGEPGWKTRRTSSSLMTGLLLLSSN